MTGNLRTARGCPLATIRVQGLIAHTGPATQLLTIMTDLTVLVSPIPIYPESNEFVFGRRSLRPLTPIMVTLETEIDKEADQEASKVESPTNDKDFITPPSTPKRRIRTPTTVDNNLLSPPVNTWRSRPRHRPTRSQSAPPERRSPPTSSQDVRILEFNNLEGDSSAIALGRALKRSSTPTLLSRSITRGGELVRPPPPLCMSFMYNF